MSASISPTRAPCFASATARLTATVDLPTPPLPLETAMMFPRFGYATGVGAGTAARLDCGSWPITGSARPFDAAAGGADAAPGCDDGRFDCDESLTSTLTSVTP